MGNIPTRRQAIGQALLGTLGAASGPAGAEAAHTRPSEGGQELIRGAVTAIGLFSHANKVSVPAGSDFLQTSGHTIAGRGAARYSYDRAVDTAYVKAHPRTAFLVADGRGFRLAETCIDVLQLGAAGDGITDDTLAMQAALDFVEARGGGTVSLPVGEYRISAALRLPGRVGIEGEGPYSILRAYGCHGIDVLPSDGIGPRRVANFRVHGQGAEAFDAIHSDIASPKRAQGIVFENLFLTFFGTGVRARGLWHATFRSITINQVRGGFHLCDRNVKIVIDDCRVTHGDLMTDNADSIGVQVGDAAYKLRPEDVQLHRTIIYGFDKAVVWRMALFGGIVNCDLDACKKTGLELVTADGGFAFRDNWVQLNSKADQSYGINGTALGYMPQLSNISIANNHIYSSSERGTSHGIFLGRNQANVAISSNSVSGNWTSGLKVESARQVTIVENRIASQVSLSGCNGVLLRDNYTAHQVTLSENENTQVERNLSLQ